MSGDLPSLNAHESPPHALKELYKRYQKLKLEDLDFDSKVIDLSKNYISDDTVILKPIPLAHLQSIFGRFVDEDDKLLATIQDSPVYSQKRLPGRRFYFMLRFSFKLISFEFYPPYQGFNESN
jgi:hypothetical protein